jgi:hypothetical protein
METNMATKDHEDPHPSAGKAKEAPKEAPPVVMPGALPPATEHGQPFHGSINEPPGSHAQPTEPETKPAPKEEKKPEAKHEEPPRRYR